ncbi:MAG: DUF1320 domain-containing protein [Deltaproteobacteria bacterium]|nr:DUF1320 domain-containing protein [Deltaproteobacteria bacterium]
MPTVYATAADVREDLGENRYMALSDRDGDGSADTTAVDLALANASSTIDGYIVGKLPVGGELATVPAWLKKVAIDLAIYDLSETPSEAIKDKHLEAMKMLRDCARGLLELGVPVPTVQSESEVDFDGPDHVFKRSQTTGML